MLRLSADADNGLHEKAGGEVNYAALLRSAVVALMRNKMRSVLTVLGITIGIAAVFCVVAIGNAGQARVEQERNNLGDHVVWIGAGGRPAQGGGTDPQGTQTAGLADAVLTRTEV